MLRCHENAFEFYGGRTEEIVYDQDKLITVSENGGDIIFTEEFQSYKQQRGFSVHLCRAADPESKGKVENVVKFIKGNFAKHRVFYEIDTWNEQCLKWLERKGNYQVHNTIKKRPVEVFALEKPHLRKVSNPLSFESNLNPIITRIVHKDNIIKFRSNRYSVPLGTYKPNANNNVYLRIEQDTLIIEKSPEGEILAEHKLSKSKGKLIKNKNHSRDRTKGISAYMETVKKLFGHPERIQLFLDEIQKHYPRYMRDQLQIIQSAAKSYSTVIDQAVEICIKDKFWSANDLLDIAIHLEKTKNNSDNLKTGDIPITGCVPNNYHEKATLRELDGYIKILGGSVE